jgi:hypothetical protein
MMEVLTVKCDRCTKEEIVEHHNVGSITPITIDFGYGSVYDGEKWHFHLCDDCIDDVVKPFHEKIEVDDTL